MSGDLKIAMLLSDAFGGFGGISQFNRDFLTALDAARPIERIYVLPRVVAEPTKDLLPETVIFDRAAARTKFGFVWRFLVRLVRDDGVNLVICGHLHLLVLAYVLARLRRARLALIIHGVEAWTPSHNWLVRQLVRRIDCFIAVSRYSALRFTAWSGVPMEKGFILPNCVDLGRFRPGPRDPILVERYGLDRKRVLLTLGRLEARERYKGVDEVIELLPGLIRRYPELVYLLAGDGSDRARLEQKVERLGLTEHVRFAGRVAEQEKVAHYNLAEVFVMPSTGEGFGIVLIEAAACGTAVIGSSTDGSREALLDGALGILVEPGNPAALNASITHALEMPASRARHAGVSTYSVQSFRTRVANWVEQQIEARRPLDRTKVSSPVCEIAAGP